MICWRASGTPHVSGIAERQTSKARIAHQIQPIRSITLHPDLGQRLPVTITPGGTNSKTPVVYLIYYGSHFRFNNMVKKQKSNPR